MHAIWIYLVAQKKEIPHSNWTALTLQGCVPCWQRKYKIHHYGTAVTQCLQYFKLNIWFISYDRLRKWDCTYPSEPVGLVRTMDLSLTRCFFESGHIFQCCSNTHTRSTYISHTLVRILAQLTEEITKWWISPLLMEIYVKNIFSFVQSMISHLPIFRYNKSASRQTSLQQLKE